MLNNPIANILYAVQPPQTVITIALDTAYLEGLPAGKPAETGIYMIDNRLNLKSSGEGTMNLHTNCYTGDNIAWQALIIDPERDDTVAILGFTIISGNVFGGSLGLPKSTTPSCWIGRSINNNTLTQYQISFLITDANSNIYTCACQAFITTI